jgi:gliding motility-associated lipoprotein GldD
MKPKLKVVLFSSILLFFNCREEENPLPYGQIRIELPTTVYALDSVNCPYSFYMNTAAQWEPKENCWGDIYYPSIKARMQLTYKSLEGNIEKLLSESQDLAFTHASKASGIQEKVYMNVENKVYGILYRMSGDAASGTQFYVTDSTNHFLRGVVYIYAAPNPDSLKPVDDFMASEVIQLMETLTWKN